MSVNPGEKDFTCIKGSTFSKIIQLTAAGNPLDLTGKKVKMQVRKTYKSQDPIVEFNSDNTGAGKVTITPAEGKIELKISATTTSTFTVSDPEGNIPPQMVCYYDLDLIGPDNEVETVLRGQFIIQDEVTRNG